MQSRRHDADESEETGIDLAPMLDFVMNLLIFFIITTSFVKEAGIVINKQEALTAESKESGNILIAIRPEVTVNADGSVRGAKVLDSKPRGVFEASAVQAVMRWKFKPKIKDGKPVEQKGSQKIELNLSQKTASSYSDGQEPECRERRSAGAAPSPAQRGRVRGGGPAAEARS